MSDLLSDYELILSLAKLSSGLLIAFAAAPFLKRPELRATFWTGVLIILPTVIVATHGRGALDVLPRPTFAERLETHAPVERAVVPQDGLPLFAAESELVATYPSAREADASKPKHQAAATKTNWYAVVFYSGAALSLLPVLISLAQLRLMSRKPAGEVANTTWEKIRPKSSPAVPLYLTNSPSAPFTAGAIRAAVFLPESSADWSLRRLKSTLHHEAAHISRMDPLVRLLVSLVRALLWFHPLVWLAHRQLVIAQEKACDEIAMAAGIPPDEYAEDLLETVKGSRSAFAHSLHMARWSQLGSRIQSILTKDKTDNPPMTMKNKATAILGITIATCGLSTLGFSEPAAPKEVAEPAEATSLFGEAANPKPEPFDLFDRASDVKPEAQTKLEKKLDAILFPSINFEDVTIEDAIEFLRQRSVELDALEKDAAKKGVNFVIKLPRDRAVPTVRELRLRNVPLRVALKFICEATEMNYEVTEYAVSITSPPDGKWEKAEK